MKHSYAPEIIACLTISKLSSAQVCEMLPHIKPRSIRWTLCNLHSREQLVKSRCPETGHVMFSLKPESGESLVRQLDKLLAPLRGWRIA